MPMICAFRAVSDDQAFEIVRDRPAFLCRPPLPAALDARGTAAAVLYSDTMTAADAWATFRENAPQIVAGLIVVAFSIWVLLRRR